MKRLVMAMLIGLSFAVPVRADMIQDLNAAFAKEDAEALQAVIAANPGQEGTLGAAITNKVAELLAVNPALAEKYMDKTGTLCSANMDKQAASDFAQALRNVMTAISAANADGKGNENTNGVLSAAMTCAGQPSIVAEDPSLYLAMLADASDQTDPEVVQFARQQLIRSGDNQIGRNQVPTTTLSTEF